jgi:hypothetical protein
MARDILSDEELDQLLRRASRTLPVDRAALDDACVLGRRSLARCVPGSQRLVQLPRARSASSRPPPNVPSPGLSSETRARSSVRSASVSDLGLPSRVA